jgi:pimeloyl-ACP methyl ester carboxylesterase
VTIQTRTVEANGLRFRCRVAGERGEPVMLLHGFPETASMWSELMPLLAQAGYRCIAPDQRGYSPGARPAAVDAYDIASLTQDVAEIAKAVGFERFHLIGHDWGSGVGWHCTRNHAAVLASWTAMSVPHLASYGHAYRNDPEQKQASEYIEFLLRTGEAETALSLDDFARLRAGSWVQASAAQLSDYLSVFSQPGALTGALNWYRAAFGTAGLDRLFAPFEVHVPTLTLWGRHDAAVSRSTTSTEQEYMRGPYRFVELDAGHWLIQERFDECSRAILEHLKAHPIGDRRAP